MYILSSDIYIVDDDELILATLNNVLFCAGFNVHTFSTAAAFLGKIKNVEQGCLIFDLKMPEINGLELQKTTPATRYKPASYFS